MMNFIHVTDGDKERAPDPAALSEGGESQQKAFFSAVFSAWNPTVWGEIKSSTKRTQHMQGPQRYMQKVRHTTQIYISILTKSFDSSLLRMKDNLLKNNVQHILGTSTWQLAFCSLYLIFKAACPNLYEVCYMYYLMSFSFPFYG